MKQVLDINTINKDCFLYNYIENNPEVEVGIHPKCNGHYILSDGKVYSKMCDKFLLGYIGRTNNGYHKVMIQYGNTKRNCRVHRLVAETFLVNDNDLPEVDHIDRNRVNNHLSNLRWVSRSENLKNRDMTNVGRKKTIL